MKQKKIYILSVCISCCRYIYIKYRKNELFPTICRFNPGMGDTNKGFFGKMYEISIFAVTTKKVDTGHIQFKVRKGSFL